MSLAKLTASIRAEGMRSTFFRGSRVLIDRLERRMLRKSLRQCSQAEFFGAFQPNVAVKNGRSVADGYARGWGLQFGGLRAKCLQDPIYVEAARYARGRTLVAELNLMNLFLILRFFLRQVPFGHLVEFGSYRGGSALFMAAVARAIHPEVRVFALDTFAGMPATDKTIDAHSAGDFADANLDELRCFAKACRIDNIEFVPGLFEDTTPNLLRRIQSVALAHVDCDTRGSVETAYECVRPHVVKGGYLVFDDALVSSCIGATEAVENLLIRRDRMNSEQVFPHYVFRAP